MNNAGSVVWLTEYQPYGQLYGESGSVTIGDPNSTGIAWKPKFRFPGQYQDDETALYYNHHRYYQPGLGNYTRPDPIGTSMGSNHLYGYTRNDPVNMKDHDGLTPKPSAGVWCDQIMSASPGGNDGCCGNAARAEVMAEIKKIENIIRNLQSRGTPGGPGQRVVQVAGLDNKESRDNPFAARPWIIPSGNQCIDMCACAHEMTHQQQYNKGWLIGAISRLPLTTGEDLIHPSDEQRLNNELTAYVRELSCLHRSIR
jgi:RHS repeat-associated protein